MELCRPSDSHLEHVDFECLFSCLSLRLLLRVFGSLLLERRVIFTADKLRSVKFRYQVQNNSENRKQCQKRWQKKTNCLFCRRGQGKSQSSGTVFGLE